MATQWLRRAWLLAACASALVLVACGGASIVDPFQPTRVVAFGDASADMGANGTGRYTVNDTSASNNPLNIWTQYVAAQYGIVLLPQAEGGFSFAKGGAHVRQKPAGNSAPTIEEQITAFGASFTTGDLVLVSAGASDLETQLSAYIAGTQTAAVTSANVHQAALDLAAQVKRIVDAGAKHVAVAGPFNLSRSPWAALAQNKPAAALILSTSQDFNLTLEGELQRMNLGGQVLFMARENYYNLVTGNPGNYGFVDSITPVCTTADASTCTPSTLIPAAAGTAYNTYVFADNLNFTPAAQIGFGATAYSAIHGRW